MESFIIYESKVMKVELYFKMKADIHKELNYYFQRGMNNLQII